jgi:hypothetical protein
MKQLTWLLAAVCLFFLGDRGAGVYFERQVAQSQFRYARLYRGDAAADILLVGNSRGLAFFQPYIEQKTGLRTFNLSYNGLPADVAGTLIQDYYDRYPAPACLLIDITLCDRLNPALAAGFMMYSGYSSRLSGLLKDSVPNAWLGGRVSALFRYNHELFQRALYYRRQGDTDWLLDRQIGSGQAAEVASASYQIPLLSGMVEHLTKAIKTAQAKGSRVELVISPYFPRFEVIGLQDLKNALEQTTGLKVRDNQRAIGEPACFGDYMHLNQKGAQVYIDSCLLEILQGAQKNPD